MNARASKICSVCKKSKPRSRFWADRHLRDGLASKCKSCAGQINKAYRKAHPSEKRRIVNRKSMLKIEYGMTLEQYQQMYNAQRGLCAICGEPEEKPTYPNAIPRILSVDHDHITGAIRGLLCRSCNLGLGMFKEDPIRIQKVLAYLDLYKPQVNEDAIS